MSNPTQICILNPTSLLIDIVDGASTGPGTPGTPVVLNASGTLDSSLLPGGVGYGTVTSVGLSVPSFLSVSGSPVTTSGTLAVSLATQAANLVFAGPATGSAVAPTFRNLILADLPSGVGTVTSVALSSPSEFSVTGSPVTGTGTLTFSKANQSANTLWAGPIDGSPATPAFRAIVAADLGTGTANTTTYLRGDLTWQTVSGGSVSSVGLTVPSFLNVSGSPVTSSGTLAVSLATQTANTLFAGPATGSAVAPTFRGIVAADLGTGTANTTTYLRGDLTWQTVSGGSGTVTSVAATVPSEFSISGSPITTSGTLAISKATQTANTIWAGPTTGSAAAPAFRALVPYDINSAVNAQTGTSYAIADTDKGKLVTFSNTSAIAATIGQAGTSGLFSAQWHAYFTNLGTGTVTITPATSTINGNSTLVISTGQSAILWSDGTNYEAITMGGSAASGGAADISLYFPGTYAGSQRLAKVIPTRDVTLPINLTNSLALADTAPTGSISITISKGTIGGGAPTSIGSVNFAAGIVTGTFTFTSSVSLNGTGDYLVFTAPGTADGTLAGVSITIYATRSN